MRKLLLTLLFICLLLPAAALAEGNVYFSHESGFYDDPIDLEILCDDPEALIYYTLDGTAPTLDSVIFDGALTLEDRTQEPNDLAALIGFSRNQFKTEVNVTKAHVIRAMAEYEDGSLSEVISGTFFVGVDREELYGDVPVISLMTDREGFFGYENGIYTMGAHFDEWNSQQLGNYEDWQVQGNFSQKGRDWERPVTVQFLTADGSEGFTQDMGVRIKGGVSRSFAQKSLRLIARADYGEKNLTYPVFENNLRADGNGMVEKYKSITLRNGGNDTETTRLRDPLFQSLAEGMGFMVQATRPCVVFLNGEYWGMYTITEEYSDSAVQNNYGVDDKNVIIIKNGRVEDGEDSDIELYEKMFDFIAENDMTDPANYEQASAMLDLPGFAQYCAFHLYINNEDGIFENNNWMIWRARETSDEPYCDGQWRFLLFDTEHSADIWGDGRSFVTDNITPVITDNGAEHEDRHPQKIFYSLYQNEDFRREFITALSDVRNVYFHTDRVEETLEAMKPIYVKLMRDTYLRFGPEWIARWNLDNYQKDKLEQLATYLRGRYDRFPWMLKKVIGYEYPVEATITINDPSLGQVQVNRTLLPAAESYTGIYFTEYDLALTAIPAEGHTFKGWQVTDATLSDETAASTSVSFQKNFTVQAVFE